MSTDETRVSLIGKDISYIQKDIAEIKSSVKELAGVYATRTALEEVAQKTETRLAELETGMDKIQNQGFLVKYLPTGIVTIVAVVMEFLLISYLQNIHCITNCIK